ncbi:hypothetical protein ACF6ZU_29175 [Pseudomonas migulae]|jgi:hypothetical protein|uniref:hypothetical protein n=1 Tax=Pseudomonas migulae TaxID=78543 RepID=UPI00370FCFE6
MPKLSETIEQELAVKMFVNRHEISKDTKAVVFILKDNLLEIENVPDNIKTLRTGISDYGSIKINITPTGPVEVIEGKATFNINLPEALKGSFKLIVYTADVSEILEREYFITEQLIDELRIEIDGKPVPEGFVLRHGKIYDVKLAQISSGPIAQIPIALSSKNIEGDSKFKSNPDFYHYSLPHSWELIPESGSGRFQIIAIGQNMSETLESSTCQLEDSGLQIYHEGKLIPEGEVIYLREETNTKLKIKTGAIGRVLEVKWGEPNGYFGIAMDPDLPINNSVPLEGQTFSVIAGIQTSGNGFAIDIKLDDGTIWSRRLEFFVR